jgi:hypothetical protein
MLRPKTIVLALDDLLDEIGTRSGSACVNEIPEGGAAQVDAFASGV